MRHGATQLFLFVFIRVHLRPNVFLTILEATIKDMTTKWKANHPGEPDLETPEFHNEAEEAEWWFANREKIAVRLIKYGRKAPIETQPVTIRLPKTDIERPRLLARKRGMPYQTFIKAVLHESLRKLSA